MADILTNADLTVADKLQVSQDGLFTVHGAGTFDDLMEAVTKHVDAQFTLGRLQGAEYAKVYTASLQAAMSNAVQYLLGRSNAELIAAQILEIEAKILLLDKQGDKIDAEISLLEAKERTEAKQVEVLEAQADMIAEQAKGFLWNANLKYFKTTVDGQAVNANIEGVGVTDSIFSTSNLEAAAAVALPDP